MRLCLFLFPETRPQMFSVDSEATVFQESLTQPPKLSPRCPRLPGSGPGDYGFDSNGYLNSGASLSSGTGVGNQHDDEAGSHSSSVRNNNDSSLGSELDFRTVLKASLVISEGIHLEEVIVSLMTSVLQTAGADYGVLILMEDGNLHVETVGLLDQVTILEHEPLHTRPDLVPISVVNLVASLGEQILRNGDDPKFELTYGRDTYFRGKSPKVHHSFIHCFPPPLFFPLDR